ncbi:MAG: hypothetical protein ABIP48_03825 [Planctomycetota bacterium]
MMVWGYRVVFGMYGFWLPNDPRGSWSDFVGSWELVRFGKATKTNTRRSLAHVEHDRQLRERAKKALKYRPVHLSDPEVAAVARGFDQARQEGGYAVHACSILPEHVHLVIGRHERRIGRIVGHFKARATQRLSAEAFWPKDGRPVWAERAWKVFLNSPQDVARAIAYVMENPDKERKPKQRWSFVAPFGH